MSDKIHLIFDYQDGPVAGIADYKKSPHFFKSFFLMEKDEYDPIFSLKEVRGKDLELFEEVMKSLAKNTSKANEIASMSILYNSLEKSLVSGDVLRLRPKIVCHKSGVDGVFEVEWGLPE